MTTTNKGMKLSEAMSLGATLKPQSFGEWGDDKSTCALGAALDAIGQLSKYEAVSEKRAKQIWPWLRVDISGVYQPACAECGYKFHNILDLVMHWNDKHKHARERIAKWLEKLEPSTEMDRYYREEFSAAQYDQTKRAQLAFAMEMRQALSEGMKLLMKIKPKAKAKKKKKKIVSQPGIVPTVLNQTEEEPICL